MDIYQMRYFIQIYNDKSLTKAAKNLYISEQSLSKTIKKIEEELQIVLFERSSKGLHPTAEGKFLLERSSHILNDYDEMIDTFHKKTQLSSKTITMGISTVLYTDRLVSYICGFQEKHPEVMIEFHELGSYTCEQYMEENLIDICIALKPDNLMHYKFIPFSEYNLILLVNKQNRLSKNSILNLHELQNENFIMLPTGSKIRSIISEHCMKCNFSPNIIITTSNIDFIYELIDINKGIAILPEFHSRKANIVSNNISGIYFDNSLPKIEAGFIIPKDRKSTYITEQLMQYLSNLLNPQYENK
jgi:DNA-binding transcriptional LysR family regulator